MRTLTSEILLSVKSGLTTHVSPSLRAVTVDFDTSAKRLILHFFYDGEITDELFDLASCATTEINPGFFDYEVNSDFTTRLDYPKPIPIEGRLVYLRYEPLKTIYRQKNAFEYADASTLPIARLSLSMQDALLEKVTPQLRMVSVEINPIRNELGFYFIYDGEISELNFHLANQAITEAAAPFSGHIVKKQILRLDLPKRIPNWGTSCTYLRAETYDLID